MSFFSVPLSGLTAAQGQLQSVSNNLANLNTDGFKDQNVSFSDLFVQAGITNGSGDPLQTGAGVKAAATSANFTEGNLNATGVSSNMALSGNGFFVTQGANGLPDYTRAGDFTTNSSGQLSTPNGELLMGYPAVNGVVSSSSTLQPLQVGKNAISPASATSSFQISANLNANAATTDAPSSSTLPIYDSLGSAHVLTITYTKSTSAPNTWNYNVTLPPADISGPTGGAGGTGIVASGSLSFDGSGKLTGPGGVAPTTLSITVPSFTNGATTPTTLSWKLDDGAGNPTITQTATASGTSATSQDGYASGTLTSYSVLPDGTVEGTFSSGKTLALGQVAVATFANNQGLSRIGNSNYQATSASGSAVIGLAGSGGRGTVVGGSVEQSNVDIATEFARLIVAQQAYQANAKSVTTFDQISQATIAMKT